MPKQQIINVLIVEDNPADIELLGFRLTEASTEFRSFRWIAAQELAQAYELLHAGGFDVVLLDLGLKDSGGLNTLESFLAEFPSQPVIVLTGMHDEDLAVQAVNAGAQDLLLKDKLDERLLRRSIRYSIQRHWLGIPNSAA